MWQTKYYNVGINARVELNVAIRVRSLLHPPYPYTCFCAESVNPFIWDLLLTPLKTRKELIMISIVQCNSLADITWASKARREGGREKGKEGGGRDVGRERGERERSQLSQS